MEQRFAVEEERLSELAAELVSREVDLILAVGTPAIRAAMQVTPTLPQEGRYEKAERSWRAALKEAEEFGQQDARLATSL